MNDMTTILSQPIARLGASTITLGQALGFGALLLMALFVALAIALWRAAKARAVAAYEGTSLACSRFDLCQETESVMLVR